MLFNDHVGDALRGCSPAFLIASHLSLSTSQEIVMQSHYEQLASINVNEHVERKNGLAYLSWTWALDQLMRLDPEASWSYAEPRIHADTVMVFCTVRAFGKERTAQLPVMDHRHRAIPNPDAFQINTAMQRALAKAIALHGLGLYLYAGEDLPAADAADRAPVPENMEFTVLSPEQLAKVKALLAETGTSVQRLLAFFRVESLEKIPATEYPRVIQTLEAAKRRAA
jgi:hypothetical protein